MTRQFDKHAFAEALEAAGLDVATLGKRCDLDAGDLRRLRRGEDPGALVRVRIARVLGADVDALWPDGKGQRR